MRNAPSPLRDLAVEDRVLPAAAFLYVQRDVPVGVTLDEWRLARDGARRGARLDARRERRAALVAHLRRWIGRR
jgi:hypothetical protein